MIIENKLIKIPDSEYFSATEYINSSMLKTLYKGSSLHLTVPRSESKEMNFGSAAHKYILEPEYFSKEYFVTPSILDGSVINGLPTLRKLPKTAKPADKFIDGSKFDGQKLDGKTLEHKLFTTIIAQQNLGKKAITESDMYVIQQLQEKMYDTGMYEKYFLHGKAERAIFTTITVDGVNYKVKIKIDYIMMGETIVVIDYKTCQSAKKSDNLNDIRKNMYELQAAFYRDIVWHVFKKDVQWIWAFAEKSAPFQTTFYEMPEWMYFSGKAKYTKALKEWSETVDKGVIRGYKEAYEIGTFESQPSWWS
jgi:protein associated with RNAse G/E